MNTTNSTTEQILSSSAELAVGTANIHVHIGDKAWQLAYEGLLEAEFAVREMRLAIEAIVKAEGLPVQEQNLSIEGDRLSELLGSLSEALTTPSKFSADEVATAKQAACTVVMQIQERVSQMLRDAALLEDAVRVK